jgi:hypothetical protein
MDFSLFVNNLDGIYLDDNLNKFINIDESIFFISKHIDIIVLYELAYCFNITSS